MREKYRLDQRRLEPGKEGPSHFFSNLKPVEIPKYHGNIICLSSKNKYFFKIWRAWLKNWAYHALLNFEIWMGVAGSIFVPHPPNFEKICIFYRQTNDVSSIFWYSCIKTRNFKKTCINVQIPTSSCPKWPKSDKRRRIFEHQNRSF